MPRKRINSLAVKQAMTPTAFKEAVDSAVKAAIADVKGSVKDMQVQVRMPSALHEKLRYRAYQERRSVGGVIRLLIEDGLKRGAGA